MRDLKIFFIKMISSRKFLRLFILILTASTFFNSAIAITGNGKRQEKLAKYKTPQLVYFVNTVVDYLEKNQDKNPRHLTLLKKCKTTLDSNKKRLIGIEVVNIKQCKNLSTSGLYNVKQVALNSNSVNILVDNNAKTRNPEKQINIKRESNSSLSQVAQKPQSKNKSKPFESFNEENTINLSVSFREAQKELDDVQASIDMYIAISNSVKKQKPEVVRRILKSVEGKISALNRKKDRLQAKFSRKFSTPIRPTNEKLNRTSFRASQIFPKIPFYIPGSSEIGEMLTIPRVTEQGDLVYRLDFLDPTSTYEKVRDSIAIPHENINGVINALLKIDKWTETAQQNNVTRNLSKTALCIPNGKCQTKKRGTVSTEILFQLYEDGSTAGRIQRNKGTFATGYNMSVESSLLMAAYLTYMRDIGAREFNLGNMTDAEVKSLFN